VTGPRAGSVTSSSHGEIENLIATYAELVGDVSHHLRGAG
jgi:hypothetical protein